MRKISKVYRESWTEQGIKNTHCELQSTIEITTTLDKNKPEQKKKKHKTRWVWTQTAYLAQNGSKIVFVHFNLKWYIFPRWILYVMHSTNLIKWGRKPLQANKSITITGSQHVVVNCSNWFYFLFVTFISFFLPQFRISFGVRYR